MTDTFTLPNVVPGTIETLALIGAYSSGVQHGRSERGTQEQEGFQGAFGCASRVGLGGESTARSVFVEGYVAGLNEPF